MEAFAILHKDHKKLLLITKYPTLNNMPNIFLLMLTAGEDINRFPIGIKSHWIDTHLLLINVKQMSTMPTIDTRLVLTQNFLIKSWWQHKLKQSQIHYVPNLVYYNRLVVQYEYVGLKVSLGYIKLYQVKQFEILGSLSYYYIKFNLVYSHYHWRIVYFLIV